MPAAHRYVQKGGVGHTLLSRRNNNNPVLKFRIPDLHPAHAGHFGSYLLGKEDRPTVLAIVKALADELTVTENLWFLVSLFVATLFFVLDRC